MIDLATFDDDHLWCGVFQGGGARGAAYAGALEALEARGHWFRAVAGSSAGAITAALVAAGLDAADIRRETPKLLATVTPETTLDRVAHRSAGTTWSATTATPWNGRWTSCCTTPSRPDHLMSR